MRTTRLGPLVAIGLGAFALMALLMAAPAAKAASERCSGNGFSVWCHRYWWGYTQCNLYDKTGDLVSEHVSPQDSCQEIQ